MTLDGMSIATGLLLVSLFAAYSIFAYRYARYSPWKATWRGVTLEAQKITLAATVLFFFIDTLVVGPWVGRVQTLTVLLTLLSIEAWATLWGLVSVQRRSSAKLIRKRKEVE